MCKDRSVVVVLDALDECPTSDKARKEVLDWIENATRAARIRYVVTSRAEHDIKTAFDKNVSDQATIEIGGGSVNADIKAFVHACVHEPRGELDRWKSRPDVQQNIETNLVERADGM
jgi:hypothetical protein